MAFLAASRGMLTIKSAQNPQRARQCGEIGEQGENKRRRGNDAELAHRRQVRKRQRQKAAGVDEGRKQNRAAGDQQGVLQSAVNRAGRAAFLKMVVKVYLVILG